MKKIDRILNILILVLGAVYIIGRFAVPPEERQKILAETAQQEFSANIADTQPVEPSANGKTTPAETSVAGDMAATSGEISVAQPFSGKDFQQLIKSDSPTLVFTFASWCPYCKKLLPSIIAMAHENHPGLRIVAISMDESADDLKKYLQLHPDMGFPVFRIENQHQKLEYKTLLSGLDSGFDGGIPYTALYNDGRLMEEMHGVVAKEKLESIVKPYLKTPPSPAI